MSYVCKAFARARDRYPLVYCTRQDEFHTPLKCPHIHRKPKFSRTPDRYMNRATRLCLTSIPGDAGSTVRHRVREIELHGNLAVWWMFATCKAETVYPNLRCLTLVSSSDHGFGINSFDAGNKLIELTISPSLVGHIRGKVVRLTVLDANTPLCRPFGKDLDASVLNVPCRYNYNLTKARRAYRLEIRVKFGIVLVDAINSVIRFATNRRSLIKPVYFPVEQIILVVQEPYRLLPFDHEFVIDDEVYGPGIDNVLHRGVVCMIRYQEAPVDLPILVARKAYLTKVLLPPLPE